MFLSPVTDTLTTGVNWFHSIYIYKGQKIQLLSFWKCAYLRLCQAEFLRDANGTLFSRHVAFLSVNVGKETDAGAARVMKPRNTMFSWLEMGLSGGGCDYAQQ